MQRPVASSINQDLESRSPGFLLCDVQVNGLFYCEGMCSFTSQQKLAMSSYSACNCILGSSRGCWEGCPSKECGSIFTFLMTAGNRQDAIVRAHGCDHQNLVAHLLGHCGQEAPADAVKVVKVLQHDGQWAVSDYKLLEYLQGNQCDTGTELTATAPV